MYVCPECANEWPCGPESDEVDAGLRIVDSNGNVLSDGGNMRLPMAGPSGEKPGNIRLMRKSASMTPCLLIAGADYV